MRKHFACKLALTGASLALAASAIPAFAQNVEGANVPKQVIRLEQRYSREVLAKARKTYREALKATRTT